MMDMLMMMMMMVHKDHVVMVIITIRMMRMLTAQYVHDGTGCDVMTMILHIYVRKEIVLPEFEG